MTDRDWLAERFEAERRRLRAVAYRMLGSLAEADDALQEAWLRVSRADAGAVENMSGWLTTIVARVCLNMLESRRARREDSLELRMPDPIVARPDGLDPEHEALLADSVGLALLVVLEKLAPAERVAFVLHDVFGAPFEEIGPIVGRTPIAARQLASRARRRVQSEPTASEVDVAGQWEVIDAFLAASRKGDFERLLAVLDPEVVLRKDPGALAAGVPRELRGAQAIARGAVSAAQGVGPVQPVLVNGAAGVVAFDRDGRPFSVMAFVVAGGRIVAIDVLTDPERLARLDLSAVRGQARPGRRDDGNVPPSG